MKVNSAGAIIGSHWTQVLRLVAVGAVVATPSLMLATPAEASVPARAEVSGQVVRFTSTDGTNNNITVNRLGTTYLIDDRVAIVAGTGCAHPNANDRTQVWCEAPNATSVRVAVGGGNDRVTSNVAIKNVLLGGRGDDRLQGGNRGDELYGGLGNDKLYGQLGNDTLNGGAGRDLLYGWKGADKIYGGTGDDTLYGQNGDDELYGNENRDFIDGGSGHNRIRGGAGPDQCVNGPDIAQC